MRCPATNGGLECDLRAGHHGKHVEITGYDDEGRPDDGAVWGDNDAPGVVVKTEVF